MREREREIERERDRERAGGSTSQRDDGAKRERERERERERTCNGSISQSMHQPQVWPRFTWEPASRAPHRTIRTLQTGYVDKHNRRPPGW